VPPDSCHTLAATLCLNIWCVCITAVIRDRNVYILNVMRARLEFPELRTRAIEQARQHQAQVLLIEDQASGTQLIQTLRAETPSGVPSPIARRP
jgi:phage terminase large subunit-like protein